jgi:hypothetical protein
MGLRRFSDLLGRVTSDLKEAPNSASPGVAFPGSLGAGVRAPRRPHLYAYPTYGPLRMPCCERGHKSSRACAPVRTITQGRPRPERIPITITIGLHSVQ